MKCCSKTLEVTNADHTSHTLPSVWQTFSLGYEVIESRDVELREHPLKKLFAVL